MGTRETKKKGRNDERKEGGRKRWKEERMRGVAAEKMNVDEVRFRVKCDQEEGVECRANEHYDKILESGECEE